MNYAGVDSVIGLYQPNFVYTVDTIQRVKTGMVVTAYDSYWGWGEFIYGKATATITMGSVSTITPTLTNGALEYQMTAAARVASSARPYCVAMASLTVGQFGWFAVSGLVPVKAAASIAAGGSFAIDTGGAGAIGAAAATFGVQGAMSVLPSATAVAKTGCSGRSGDFNITIPNGEGWFIGAVLSGTGVGAGAKVVSITPDGRTCTVDVANSAAIVGGTVTATYTGFIVALISRPAGLGL